MRYVLESGPDPRIPQNDLISDHTTIADLEDIEGFPLPAMKEAGITTQDDESQGQWNMTIVDTRVSE